jgi:hypothetical protein
MMSFFSKKGKRERWGGAPFEKVSLLLLVVGCAQREGQAGLKRF